MGNIYHKLGLHDKCFEKWISYYDNINNSFCPSIKKMLKVQNFLTQYYSICNSVLKFKNNLFYFKDYQPNSTPNSNNSAAYNYINLSYSNNNKILENNNNNNIKVSSNTANDFDSESQNDLKNFFDDFVTLYNYKQNLKENYTENYEYYRALIHIYINSNSFYCF